jgi:hypothetical protein
LQRAKEKSQQDHMQQKIDKLKFEDEKLKINNGTLLGQLVKERNKK